MAIEDELYQEIILEHYRATHNRRVLEGASYKETGHNPACGDRLVLFMDADAKEIRTVTYEGSGCAICCASANMLCELLPHSWEQAEALYARVHGMLTGKEVSFAEAEEDLEAIRGVRKFPTRIKCALLPWSALHAIIKARTDV